MAQELMLYRPDLVTFAESGPKETAETEARCLFEGGFRTNPEDPQSVALSDHLPVIAVFG